MRLSAPKSSSGNLSAFSAPDSRSVIGVTVPVTSPCDHTASPSVSFDPTSDGANKLGRGEGTGLCSPLDKNIDVANESSRPGDAAGPVYHPSYVRQRCRALRMTTTHGYSRESFLIEEPRVAA